MMTTTVEQLFARLSSEKSLHRLIAHPSEGIQSNWIRTRHERESDAAVAIFVLSYENTKKPRPGTLPCLGCHGPAANAAFWKWTLCYPEFRWALE